MWDGDPTNELTNNGGMQVVEVMRKYDANRGLHTSTHVVVILMKYNELADFLDKRKISVIKVA